WTVAAAEAVVGTKHVRDDLHRLIDWSLITSIPQQEPLRFRMLEILHRYAAERLNLGREAEAVRGRHLDYYLKFAEEAAAGLNAEAQDRILNRLEGGWENLPLALG